MSASSLNIYHPGDLVISEEPFVSTVFQEYQRYFCDHCIQTAQTKRCASCNYVHYCDKACQKAAWPDHKLECKYLKKCFGEVDDSTRTVGKVILKLKGKDWKSVTANVAGNERSFDDLISHREEAAKDRNRRFQILLQSSLLKNYLGKDNLPEEKVLHEIIGKVKHNGMFFEHNVGGALYIGASVFDHSCIPNAVVVYMGKAIEIRTICDVPCATFDDIGKNITISYVSTVCDELDAEYIFFGPCKCLDCSLPYGESTLTKIIDKTKADSVIKLSKSILKNMPDPIERTLLFQMRAAEILKKQEGVLGSTNILRLRLLYHKFMCPPSFRKMEDLKMFIDLVKSVFGPSSDILAFPYELAEKQALADGDVRSANKYAREAERLTIVHYGKKPMKTPLPMCSSDAKLLHCIY